MLESTKYYDEPAASIPVYAECDILVVGGGAAGHAAALAAARAGAKNIILMERYGYMGGDATGGYVIMVPNLSWYDKAFVRGIQEEWFDRIEAIPGAVKGPSLSEIGSTDPAKLYPWGGFLDCTSRTGYEGAKPQCLVRAVHFEPNELKIAMDEMLYEERDAIKICYHSWVTKPIVEDNTVKGVIFESKEGRKAIFAKVVIDATGDGDLYSKSGAPYASLADGTCRSSTTALVYRVGGVDWNVYREWQAAHPTEAQAFMTGLSKAAGYRVVPFQSSRDGICWIDNWHSNMDCTVIADQTNTEIRTRLTIHDLIHYMRECVPVAFQNAYLYDIAPQLGCRCSRRLVGEYVMTADDFAFAKKHDDVIAWHSTICQINDCGPVEIPYRAILPQKVEGLLAPGRHLSTDDRAIDWLNLIPQCVGTGQGAGVAAAVAVMDGTTTHHVDIKKVQDILVDQNVPLPRNAKFEAKDPSYRELVEEKQYGLYTTAAKVAAQKGGLRSFQQDHDYSSDKDDGQLV